MNLDELKTTWRNEMELLEQQRPFDPQRIITAAQVLDRKFYRSLYLEIGACIIVFAVLLSYLFRFGVPANIALQFSYAIAVFTLLNIPYKLITATRADNTDWTLASRLRSEISKLEKRGKLLNNIANWYLAPILTTVFLGSWGFHYERVGVWAPDKSLVIYWLLCIVLGALILYYNHYVNRRHVAPALERMRELERQLGR